MAQLVIDGVAVDRHVTPQQGARRKRMLARTVPRLVSRHLAGPLGWRRFVLMARLPLLTPRYRRRFARAGDDPGLREVKETFLLVGVLYHELTVRIGAEAAQRVMSGFLYDLANAVQRHSYIPAEPAASSWEEFHAEHEAQMAEGFIRNNDNSGVRTAAGSYRFEIVRCRFHEAFRDMGAPAITEAFCRSDEVVFNDVAPHEMRFHRGDDPRNTIARGGRACAFVFERIPARRGP